MSGSSRALLLLLLGACAGRPAPAAPAPTAAPPSPTATPEPSVAKPMTPSPSVSFEDGPAVTDAAALLAWLEATKGRLVRLPVVVAFDDAYRLAVARAWVGNGGERPPEGAILLKLDDSALGVALIDHLQTTCPPGPTCAVWLEGTWGPLMTGMPDFGRDPSRHDFAVRRFAGLADTTVTRVGIERK